MRGKKNIKYKDEMYFMQRLVELHETEDLKSMFGEGECVDISTGEIFDIKDIKKIWLEKYSRLNEEARDVLDYNKHYKLNKMLNNSIRGTRTKELEDKYLHKMISIEELEELIMLKYSSKEIYLSYESYIMVNREIPNLSDADLGKFYKIMLNLTHKANTILNKIDVRSNPMKKQDIAKILNIEVKSTEQYLKRLKDNRVIKEIVINNKKYLMINPRYAFSGNSVSPYTYTAFRDEVEAFSNVPDEIKSLWDYEFNISVMCEE